MGYITGYAIELTYSDRNDAKTVNVIASGCFSKHSKIVLESLKFFLTVATDADDKELEEQKKKAKEQQKRIKLRMKVVKKTRASKKKLETKLTEVCMLSIEYHFIILVLGEKNTTEAKRY